MISSPLTPNSGNTRDNLFIMYDVYQTCDFSCKKVTKDIFYQTKWKNGISQHLFFLAEVHDFF